MNSTNPQLSYGAVITYAAAIIVAVLFAFFLAKERRDRKQTNLKHVRRVMTLSDEFESIYEVNVETGAYTESTKNGVLFEDVAGDFHLNNDFFESCAKNIQLVIYPEDKEKVAQCMTKEYILTRLADEPSFTIDYRLVIDGLPVWYKLKTVRGDDWPSASTILIGVFNNDENHRRERTYRDTLEEARRQAEAASEAKSAFLFNMSHDIRTPMNAITGYTAMAKKNLNNPEKVSECLDKIEVSGNQLLTLVNQVLDMSRIESGKIQLEEEEADVIERARTMVSMFASQAQEKKITFNMNVGAVKHPLVYADPTRMNQVIMNFLSNAVKYTPEGGTVTYSVEETECDLPGFGRYRFSVADTGIGMSPEFQKHIFDSFARERSSTVSGIEGTGLGMAIAKNLADLMGGDIDIQSEPGQGTRVTLIIDMRIASGEGEKNPEPEANEDNLRGRRTLLVEDNVMNREIAAEILNEYGILVEEAEDGDIAVEKIKTSQPGYYDFVLMDIQMPRMNGFEATHAIRELDNEKLARIPIIALSANAFEEDRIKSMRAGMNGHVAKPIDINILITTLQSLFK